MNCIRFSLESSDADEFLHVLENSEQHKEKDTKVNGTNSSSCKELSFNG